MSSNAFVAVLEVDGADIEAVNRKLKALGTDRAAKAMRNGFRKWTGRVKSAAKAIAPYGRNSATEKVRGESRPNPHIRDFITTKVKGYSKGRVVWASVGVSEIRGSYATPHWYLRWVEFGHEIKRRATEQEALRMVTRGERKRKNMTVRIGHVPGRFFLRSAAMATEPLLIPIMDQAIADQIAKEWNGNG